jgi:Flp pilus assembly pilin Flp
MTKLTQKAVAAHTMLKFHTARTMDRFQDDERGQGSVEYIGIILVVVAIVGAVIAGATPIGTAIITKLTAAVNKLTTA